LTTTSQSDLRERVAAYLRAHHTMTLATAGLPGEVMPHAATVFYAVDAQLRLVFLSKPDSLHGVHIGEAAPVAVTVAAHYDDWKLIRGVQLWGTAYRLRGADQAVGMAVYLRRFPFVRELMKQPQLARLFREVGVYRVEPRRLAFTDNTTGVFGREVLDLMVE
jgi:uncharacterized protein YhbP (UPF0306 family)